jgi:hypothetical protein
MNFETVAGLFAQQVSGRTNFTNEGITFVAERVSGHCFN